VLFLQKIILQNGIGRGTNSVVSVMKMKRYNICFLTADSREWYGLRFMRLGTYQNLKICLLCLGAGSIEFLKNIKPLVLLGAAALCWSIWLCTNVVVFDNKKIFLFAGYLLNYAQMLWCSITKKSILQKHTLQDKFVAASHFLKQGAKDFFCPGI